MATLLGTTLHSLANYKREDGSIPEEGFLDNAEKVMGLPRYTFRDNPAVKEAFPNIPAEIMEQLQKTVRGVDGLEVTPEILARAFDELLANLRGSAALLETAKKNRG